MAPDLAAEQALIELSRLLRTMWDHSTLHQLEMIDAGLSQSEAERISNQAAQDRAAMEERAAA
jgi:hypothetical protein